MYTTMSAIIGHSRVAFYSYFLESKTYTTNDVVRLVCILELYVQALLLYRLNFFSCYLIHMKNENRLVTLSILL